MMVFRLVNQRLHSPEAKRSRRHFTDEAEAELERLERINPDSAAIPEHQRLLRGACERGIAQAYADLHLHNWLRQLPQAGPIGAAVLQFVQADDDAAALLLQSQAALLLTLDAGDLLQQLAEAARAAGAGDLAARLAARLGQWQAARLQGAPRPGTRSAAGQPAGLQIFPASGRPGTLGEAGPQISVLVGLAVSMGGAEFRAAWAAVTHQPVPILPSVRLGVPTRRK